METAPERIGTPEDLLRISEGPLPELINGQLIPRIPRGQRLDAFIVQIVAALGNYANPTLQGIVNGARCGFQIFPDDPNKIRVVDAAFTRRDRLPDGPVRDGHARIAPDVVVEVVTPTVTVAYQDSKIEDFLAAGVPLIWIPNPRTRTVQVHRLGGRDSRLRRGYILEGEDVLPGFRLEVAALFDALS